MPDARYHSAGAAKRPAESFRALLASCPPALLFRDLAKQAFESSATCLRNPLTRGRLEACSFRGGWFDGRNAVPGAA